MLPVRYGTGVSEPATDPHQPGRAAGDVTSATSTDGLLDPDGVSPAERLKTFVDAVVAIAMTLLVLPVMEATVELSKEERSAWALLGALHQNIIALVMSSLMIAIVWMIHSRMFGGVRYIDSTLRWLTMLWMATIVWLPVPTVMVYSIPTSDWVVKLLYTGTLVVTHTVMAASAWHLTKHPELSTDPMELLRFQAWNTTVQAALYLLVAVVVILIPGSIGFVGFFLLTLLGPAATVLRRRLGLAPGH